MAGIQGHRVSMEDVEEVEDSRPRLSGVAGGWKQSSILEPLTYGQGCSIWAYAVIEEQVTLGDAVVIGSHCYIGRGTRIGDYSRLQSRVFVPRHTYIGRYVFIGPGVLLCDDKYPQVNALYMPEPPVIHNHVSIGAGAIIGPGVTLHEGCQIGMGAVVTKDVPAQTLVYGNPARARGKAKRGDGRG